MRIPIIAVAASMLLAADTPNPKNAKVQSTLWAAISVNSPVYVSPDQAGKDPFMMYFGVVNDSDKTMDPEVESSQLLINGKELKDWDVTIANGLRDKRWRGLRPGEHLSFAYGLGRHFEKPGIYKVTWKGKGFRAPEIVFRVVARRGN